MGYGEDEFALGLTNWADDDARDEEFEKGIWTQSDGTRIKVTDMTDSHLNNAISHLNRQIRIATQRGNYDSADELDDWYDALCAERKSRVKVTKSTVKPSKPTPVVPIRGAKVDMQCHCGALYVARIADLKRGWSLSCSKRCAAIRRDYGRPPAVVVIFETDNSK